MKKLLFLALFTSTFGYNSMAQKHQKLSHSSLHNLYSQRNILTADLGFGGFGMGGSFGLDYERIFGKSGKVSVVLPVYYTTSQDHFLQAAEVGNDRYHYQEAMFIAPGIRYHPAGAYRKVHFGVAALLAIGSLVVRETMYPRSYEHTTTNYSSMLIAPMAQLSIDYKRRAHLGFGGFFSYGRVVSGDFGYEGYTKKILKPGFFQLGVKMGARF